jgi:membrane protein
MPSTYSEDRRRACPGGEQGDLVTMDSGEGTQEPAHGSAASVEGPGHEAGEDPPGPQGLLARHGRVLEGGSHVAARVKSGAAGSVWNRLNAVDFMNSSLQFAALGVLCLFPFLIVVSAGTGHDLRRTVIARMGLDHQAANDVNTLIAPGNHAVTSLDVVGGILIILGAIGIASTLQAWYERVYEQRPARRWWKQLANRLLWLLGFIVYLAAQEFIAVELTDVGARVPIYVVTLAIAVVFYWWSLHVLLLGRLGWGELLPGALATAVCITGLGVFSSLLFSGQIVSSANDYGPIGVVMILLSWLIGIGVCFHLGAVVGRAWNERGAGPSAITDSTEGARRDDT